LASRHILAKVLWFAATTD